MGMSACTSKDEEIVNKVDFLNDLAYENHYVAVDSVQKYAWLALKEVQNAAGYKDGRYEALCNLGFAKYMAMDYDSAEIVLHDVLDNSPNELYRLVADVLMMKVCQRQSENKAFYDYHNDVQQIMIRILPEVRNMTERQKKIWNFALSDYHMSLFTYYYYLRQEEDAKKELEYISNHKQILENDTAQAAMFYFLVGNSRNVDDKLSDDDSENLLEAAALARNHGYNYILAKSLTSIAEDISKNNSYRPSKMNLIRELVNLSDTVADNQLPLAVSEFALEVFNDYGSLFDVAQTYNAIADYYLSIQQNDSAMSVMVRAMDCVNQHHKRVAEDGLVLHPFVPDADSVSIEKKWIDNGVVCLPEWMADIREHLCLVYSAQGRKEESDYNRNIYLDILETTRQDKKMEQLYSTLVKEQDDVNRYILLGALFMSLLAAAVVYLAHRLKNNYKQNYALEKLAVENEMQRWRKKTDEDFSNLEEHQEVVIAEKFSKEKRLEEQKKQYINKATCLSIVYAITPFLDRAVNEVVRMKEELADKKAIDDKQAELIQTRLQYLSELVDRINVYNDILTNWIKIRQGKVSLNIENFELKPLFDILRKNTRSFSTKGIKLDVKETEAVVRADRALTLFMVNTLMENARKYSFDGGEVELSAVSDDDYVEIAVKDTGRGMTQEDVNTILEEKVYDSSKIGNSQNDEDLKRNKGFGFGLLNCKGIIEKYRKTNDIFKVCKFGIESELGKGSRFFFRLPKGMMRNLSIGVVLAVSTFLFSCETREETHIDAVHSRMSALPDNVHIQKANEYAEYEWQCNVDGNYETALVYADSAIQQLNAFYLLKHPDGNGFIHLIDQVDMNEIEWWNAGFTTDYHTILQVRNEAAIAALALNDRALYYYNNEIFTRLYKLTAQDENLEKRCNEIKEANNNRKTLLFILITSLMAGALIYYFIYYRNNILPTFSLRQILELNRRIFNNQDESQLATIIQQGVNDVRRTNGVGLYLNDGQLLFSENCPQQEYLRSMLKDAFNKKEILLLDNGKTRIYPLNVDADNCIGVIAFMLHNENLHKDDDQLFRMISQYTAENIYYSTVRMENLNNKIEMIEDEKRRAEREANAVHVQNLVIDNTLSTIKHETMYYPNRIKYLIDNMIINSKDDVANESSDKINTMAELMLYYKDVFTILADCASKQINRPMFKRKNLSSTQILDHVVKMHHRFSQKSDVEVKLELPARVKAQNELWAIADQTMLFYLFDNMLESVFQEKKQGTLTFDFEKSDDFIKFAFIFDNIHKSEDDFKNMFYPEALVYELDTDTLIGAQMLIAKQIIREHDEHVRRGCRIMAMPADKQGNGQKIIFTIPMARKHA